MFPREHFADDRKEEDDRKEDERKEDGRGEDERVAGSPKTARSSAVPIFVSAIFFSAGLSTTMGATLESLERNRKPNQPMAPRF